MNKYENGKIYKIVCNKTGKLYVGSTYKTLEERLHKHVLDYNRYLKGCNLYVSSYKILENNDFKIELLEHVQCNNVQELKKRERYHKENNDCVNILTPSKSPKECQDEYRAKNLELIKAKKNIYMKDYYINNKKVINEKSSEYRNKNREKTIQYSKDYYENHKNDNFNTYCECGVYFTKYGYNRHIKRKIHIEYLEKNKSL